MKPIAIGIAVLTIALAGHDTTAAQPASITAECDHRGLVVAAYSYTVAARVRPLLFWIRRDNVGGARIVRTRVGASWAHFELLIGSDPERAPRRINRWGYIAESACGGMAQLVGVMTDSTEASIEEAERRVNAEPGAAYLFRAIRSRITGGEATAATHRMALATNLTFRDLGAALSQVPREGGSVRRVRVPEGTASGFLTAVADLLHESVDPSRPSGARPASLRRAYVYHGELYDLTLKSSRRWPEVCVRGATYREAVESEFENRNRRTGASSSFRILYGAQGAMAEVPIRIVYRPRWWFEAELQLESGRESR